MHEAQQGLSRRRSERRLKVAPCQWLRPAMVIQAESIAMENACYVDITCNRDGQGDYCGKSHGLGIDRHGAIVTVSELENWTRRSPVIHHCEIVQIGFESLSFLPIFHFPE